MVEVRGIPDLSALPSLCMNYQSTFTISPPAGSTGTWSFDASLLPNPVCFMYLLQRTTNSGGFGVTTEVNLLNSQLDGADHTAKYLSFKNLAQRWRLCYESVTVIQDGPDLANQGTIVVSQPPVEPRQRSLCHWGTSSTGGQEMQAPATCIQFTNEDFPDFTRSQAMPNAYFNKSKEGAYVPLKLTETCQDWVSEKDDVCPAVFQPQTLGARSQGVYIIPNLTQVLYPYIDLQNATLTGTTPFYYTGQLTSKQLSGNFAHISARNLAVTTSYSFFVRMGLEMQVSPSSTLSPQLKLSPPYDPMALVTYFRICRELKDAYPADYNVTGKLWNVIKRALDALDPVISVMPGNKIVKPLVAAGVSTGDLVVARRKKNRRRAKRNKRAAQKNGGRSGGTRPGRGDPTVRRRPKQKSLPPETPVKVDY